MNRTMIAIDLQKVDELVLPGDYHLRMEGHEIMRLLLVFWDTPLFSLKIVKLMLCLPISTTSAGTGLYSKALKRLADSRNLDNKL